jgi:hypothetical protein
MPRSTNDSIICHARQRDRVVGYPVRPGHIARKEVNLASQASGEPTAPVNSRSEFETLAQAFTEHAFQRMLQSASFDPQAFTRTNVARQNLRARRAVKNGTVSAGDDTLVFAPHQFSSALKYHMEAKTINSVTFNINLRCELTAAKRDQHTAQTPLRYDRYRLIETGSEESAILQAIAEQRAVVAKAQTYSGSGVHILWIAHLDIVKCPEGRNINWQWSWRHFDPLLPSLEGPQRSDP